MALIESMKGSQTSLWKFTSQTSIICHFSQYSCLSSSHRTTHKLWAPRGPRTLKYCHSPPRRPYIFHEHHSNILCSWNGAFSRLISMAVIKHTLAESNWGGKGVCQLIGNSPSWRETKAGLRQRPGGNAAYRCASSGLLPLLLLLLWFDHQPKWAGPFHISH